MTLERVIALMLSYLIGALPMGWIIVWIKSHQDIRYHGSGRMGTSNVIRMAGIPAGLVNSVLDFLKGFAGVWVVRLIITEPPAWMEALAGFLTVLGHIYSIFIIEKRRDGKYYFRGGAGGITSLGVSTAFWLPVLLWSGIPALILYVLVGYASVATLSVNVFALIVFIVRSISGADPTWWYVVYSVVTLIIVIDTLKPNLKRLLRGDERVMRFSLHAKIKENKNGNAKTE